MPIINKDEAIKQLLAAWKDAEELRGQNTNLANLLRGTLDPNPENFHYYPFENGAVVSRNLLQGLPKNPTIGLIFPGRYNFSMKDYAEAMYILKGSLYGQVNDRPREFLPKGGLIIAPIGTTLKLETERLAGYLCRYTPKA